MTIETKFKVGELVYLKAQVEHYNKVLKPLLSNKDYRTMGDLEVLIRTPQQHMIVERMIQTCPDGTQIHYKLRANSSDGLLSYLEMELTHKLEED